MNRRSFLRGLAAPAIVAAGSLMPVRSIERFFLPTLYGDGVRDDTAAIQALIDGKPYIKNGLIVDSNVLSGGRFRLSNPIILRENWEAQLTNCSFESTADYCFIMHMPLT